MAGCWHNAVLPGGFTVFQNKLYILGGFDISRVGNGTNQIWEFTPSLRGRGCRRPLFCLFRSAIYRPRPSAASSTQVGAAISRLALLPIRQTLLFIIRWRTLSARLPAIPRATGETRALNFNGMMLVMGGGRTAPNPSNEVDIYDPGTNIWAKWHAVPAFATARRNFPTDTDGTTQDLAVRRLRCRRPDTTGLDGNLLPGRWQNANSDANALQHGNSNSNSYGDRQQPQPLPTATANSDAVRQDSCTPTPTATRPTPAPSPVSGFATRLIRSGSGYAYTTAPADASASSIAADPT